MRFPAVQVSLTAVAVLALAQVAFAIPTPLGSPSVLATFMPVLPPAVGPSAVPSAAPIFAIGAAVGAALGWGAWVLTHWQTLGELIAALVALYAAVRAHQWTKLTELAGLVAFNLATLTDWTNEAKRKEGVTRLYAAAGPIARLLFTEAQFALALETGWKLIAKPQLAGKAGG